MRFTIGSAGFALALVGAVGCQSTTSTMPDGAIIIGSDDGPAADLAGADSAGIPGDASGAIDQLGPIDQLGLDLCAPLATMIVHPDAGGCRTPAMAPVMFRGLVSASCVGVTNQANFTWSTTPTSPLDGLTGNDRMATLPLGTYTIGLTVTYMNKTAMSSMTFSMKSTCP